MKRPYISIFLSLFILFLSSSLSAQLPANPIGLNPHRIKWSQIKTEQVQVIYPQGLDAQGQRVANIAHYLWDKNNESIGDKKQPVTILLQNQPSISNGFVTPGPFRSEFFLMPPQFNCTSDWLDLLAIHEYRHVKQFGNAKKGITKLVRWFSGSWGWGGMAALAWPRWYWEGDAVVAETRLSRSGRGRMPAFDMEYRSLLLDGKTWSYEKAGAGSFRDFVPDWYTLGYHLTSYGRERYGEDFWAKVAEDGVRYKGLFFPFSQSIKSRTGKDAPLFHAEMTSYRDSFYQDQIQSLETTDANALSPIPPANAVVHYNHPQFLPDGSIVYLERGYDRNPAYFLQTTDGKSKKLCNAGRLQTSPEGTLSAKAGKLCWAELQVDPRWANRNFFVIRTYDLATGKKQRLSHGARYFSPALSQKAERIVAVEVTEQMENYLVILDANTGAVVQQLPTPENVFPIYPTWSPDDKSIIVILQKDEEHRLVKIRLADGALMELSPSLPYQLSHPYAQGNKIYFSAAYTGINNIFSVDTETKNIQQITSVKTGAFQPTVSPDGQQLVYSEFSRKGYVLKSMAISQGLNTTFSAGQIYKDWIYLNTPGNTHRSILADIPRDTFAVKKFRKTEGLIFPHSWVPTIANPIYGLQILSDNKFSTLSADAQAYYNTNDNDWTISTGLTFAGWYPQLHAAFQRVNRSHLIANFYPENDTTVINNNYVAEWTENRFIGGISLPLNFSRGAFINRLFLRGDYQRLQLDYSSIPTEPSLIFRDTITYRSTEVIPLLNEEGLFRQLPQSQSINLFDLRMTLYSLQQQAIQHLYPRWGYLFQSRYRKTFESGGLRGDVFSGTMRAYLPGLLRNHSLRFTAAYQREELLNNYQFSDFFIYPRGYNAIRKDRHFKFSADYSFPLAYPDRALGPVAFIKRIKGNVFYDHGMHWNEPPFSRGEVTMNSLGMELSVDFRLFRLLEVDMGLRYSYLYNKDFAPDSERHQFDFFVVSITE